MGRPAAQAAKAFTYNVARDVGVDVENRINSDAVKLFASPVGKIVADYAMQVLGGAGYSRDYPVERLWRDAKLLEACTCTRLLCASPVADRRRHARSPPEEHGEGHDEEVQGRAGVLSTVAQSACLEE